MFKRELSGSLRVVRKDMWDGKFKVTITGINCELEFDLADGDMAQEWVSENKRRLFRITVEEYETV